MAEFALKIVTPEGLRYDGPAERLLVRTTAGDVAILPGHINYVAPLGMGETIVTVEGKKRRGACIGGMVSVVGGKVSIVATTFEWAEDIDAKRAQASYDRAQNVLNQKSSSDADIRLAQARLRRALVRKSVASEK